MRDIDPPDDIYPDDEEVEEPSLREKPMGFFDHLEELRWTLVKSAATIATFAVLIALTLRRFNNALLWPLNHVKSKNPDIVVDLGTTSILEGFSVILQMCGLGGLVLAGPFILYFVGQFISPALTQRESRLLIPVCFAAMVLFFIGAAFSFFFLVPSTLRVAMEINALFGFEMRWTPGSYYSLLIWLVLGVGTAFQFPLLIVLAVQLGFLQLSTLRTYRRHAFVGMFVIAAIVTPTPDPITQTMFAIPLYLLYETAIFVSQHLADKRAAAPR